MRLIALAAFAGLLATAAHADTMKNCAAAWKAMSPADKAADNVQGLLHDVPQEGHDGGAATGSMAASPAPAGATAMCKDNTYSMAKTASGPMLRARWSR